MIKQMTKKGIPEILNKIMVNGLTYGIYGY